jgi:hypothetical protein
LHAKTKYSKETRRYKSMTELETLSALLEAAAKRQMEADEAYHKAAEEVESIKAEMVRVKNKREKELQICLGYLLYL